jgi:hypothetical protein
MKYRILKYSYFHVYIAGSIFKPGQSRSKTNCGRSGPCEKVIKSLSGEDGNAGEYNKTTGNTKEAD